MTLVACTVAGQLDLDADYRVSQVPDMPNALTVRTGAGVPKLTLRAETRESCEEWLAAFEEALRLRRAQRRRSLESHFSTLERLALQPLVWNAEKISDWRRLLSDMGRPDLAAKRTHVSPRLHLQGHVDKVHSLCFSTDGKLVLTAAKESRLFMWDLSRPRKAASVEIELAEGGWTLSCAISPSSRLIAAGGLQEKVRACR